MPLDRDPDAVLNQFRYQAELAGNLDYEDVDTPETTFAGDSGWTEDDGDADGVTIYFYDSTVDFVVLGVNPGDELYISGVTDPITPTGWVVQAVLPQRLEVDTDSIPDNLVTATPYTIRVASPEGTRFLTDGDDLREGVLNRPNYALSENDDYLIQLLDDHLRAGALPAANPFNLDTSSNPTRRGHRAEDVRNFDARFSGAPELAGPGEDYAGTNVQGALAQLAYLLPAEPDAVGEDTSVPNSGVPLTVHHITGGSTSTYQAVAFTRAGVEQEDTTAVASHDAVNVIDVLVVQGFLYPADRGYLTLRLEDPGDSTDYTYAPDPVANGTINLTSIFNEALRATQQLDLTVAGGTELGDLVASGWDFQIFDRYPVKRDYSGDAFVGTPHQDFVDGPPTFPAQQVASFILRIRIDSAAGGPGLLSFPAWTNLAEGGIGHVRLYHFVAAPAPNFPAAPGASAYYGRALTPKVFRDLETEVGISTAPSTVVNDAGDGLVTISGLPYFTDSSSLLLTIASVAPHDWFRNVYPEAADTTWVVVGRSGYDGAVDLGLARSGFFPALQAPAPGAAATLAAIPFAPQVAGLDFRTRIDLTVTVRDGLVASAFSKQIQARFTTVGQDRGVPGRIQEWFTDEHFRYTQGYNFLVNDPPLVPAGGNAYPSVASLAAQPTALLVGLPPNDNNATDPSEGGLLYPEDDYSAGLPSGGPDYSALVGERFYQRLLMTGGASDPDNGAAVTHGQIELEGIASYTQIQENGFAGSHIVRVLLCIPGDPTAGDPHRGFDAGDSFVLNLGMLAGTEQDIGGQIHKGVHNPGADGGAGVFGFSFSHLGLHSGLGYSVNPPALAIRIIYSDSVGARALRIRRLRIIS